jgi:hypothetical protein
VRHSSRKRKMIYLLKKMFALGQKKGKAVLVLNLWESYSIALQSGHGPQRGARRQDVLTD